MKANLILILFLLFILTGCCDDFFIAPVNVNILMDEQPLGESKVYPSFVYINENGNEVPLYINGYEGPDYSINQTTELQMMSLKPATILIRYNNLPETDTLEVLLDYACDNDNKCSCNAIILKYMKCNSEMIDDYTIRK